MPRDKDCLVYYCSECGCIQEYVHYSSLVRETGSYSEDGGHECSDSDTQETDYECSACDHTIDTEESHVRYKDALNCKVADYGEDELSGEDLRDYTRFIAEARDTEHTPAPRLLQHGAHVIADIGEHRNIMCIISIQRGTVYLCQNVASGDNCAEKFGMSGSWNCGVGENEAIRRHNIRVMDMCAKNDI